MSLKKKVENLRKVIIQYYQHQMIALKYHVIRKNIHQVCSLELILLKEELVSLIVLVKNSGTISSRNKMFLSTKQHNKISNDAIAQVISVHILDNKRCTENKDQLAIKSQNIEENHPKALVFNILVSKVSDETFKSNSIFDED